MKRFSRVLAAPAILVLSLILLQACGGGGGSSNNGNTTVPDGAKTVSLTAHDSTTESINTGNDASQLAQESQLQLTAVADALAWNSDCATGECTFDLDLSGLPAAGSASSKPQFKLSQKLFKTGQTYAPLRSGGTGTDSYVAGCVHPGSQTGTAVYDAPGHNGCGSGDTQLNIDYANGEKVEYMWDCPPMGSGCTTTMRVACCGDYWGTTISYKLDWTDFYVDIKTTGRIKYKNIVNYDRCLDADWRMTWPADSSGVTINTTTDFINLGKAYRVRSNLTYDLYGDSASESGYWRVGGNTRWADIEIPQTVFALCTGATFTENKHVFEYRNITVREDWNAIPSFSMTASGDVVYDNAVIGHIQAGDYYSANIRWNDGTVEPFDPWQDMWSNFMILY